MDLRQVEYVLAVVDHGGFTRAAAALHVAQPSLSQSVRRLEDELGSPLFFRIGRSVRMTPAGEAFVGPARRLLREAQNVKATVADHAAVTIGSLDVVALPTLVADPLASIIGRFRQRHRGVSVRVLDPATTVTLLAMVADGRAEVGISDAVNVSRGLEAHSIGEQELLAVLPSEAATAARTIRLAAFARYPLVLGPPGTSTRQVVESAMEASGLTPDIGVEVNQREAVTPLVLAGAGATALPAPLAREALALGATVLPFSPRLVRPVSVVHRPTTLSPPAAAFLDLVIRSARRQRRS